MVCMAGIAALSIAKGLKLHRQWAGDCPLPEALPANELVQYIDQEAKRDRRMRRTIITAMGLSACVGLAGCLGATHSPRAEAMSGGQCRQDIKDFREKVDSALASHTIDKPVYDYGQTQVAKAEAACASGDDRLTRAVLINAAISLSIGSDDTYARSLKAQTPPSK
jgi:hypothetical protein